MIPWAEKDPQMDASQKRFLKNGVFKKHIVVFDKAFLRRAKNG